MFKRREKRSVLQFIADSLYPRGGWGRAAAYVMHRLRRLPDPPYKIARGIFAGVFTTFTPFYGFHFIIAAIIAKTVRGNILAALLSTFFGNPLTYVPIGIISLETGHFILGSRPDKGMHRSLVGKFTDAFSELFDNLWRALWGETVDWSHLARFWHDVFFPYMIGGVIPGLVAGLICYYLSVPLITAYQKRRLASLRARAGKKLAKRSAKEARSKEGTA